MPSSTKSADKGAQKARALELYMVLATDGKSKVTFQKLNANRLSPQFKSLVAPLLTSIKTKRAEYSREEFLKAVESMLATFSAFKLKKFLTDPITEAQDKARKVISFISHISLIIHF
jgi:hypothetical protein